jgi:hypothetical protein
MRSVIRMFSDGKGGLGQEPWMNYIMQINIWVSNCRNTKFSSSRSDSAHLIENIPADTPIIIGMEPWDARWGPGAPHWWVSLSLSFSLSLKWSESNICTIHRWARLLKQQTVYCLPTNENKFPFSIYIYSNGSINIDIDTYVDIYTYINICICLYIY